MRKCDTRLPFITLCRVTPTGVTFNKHCRDDREDGYTYAARVVLPPSLRAMSFKVTAHLKGLTPREAIADAFYRLFAAFDENDAELLDSALDPDVVVIVNGKEANGLEGIEEGPFKTMGYVSNYEEHVRCLTLDADRWTPRITLVISESMSKT